MAKTDTHAEETRIWAAGEELRVVEAEGGKPRIEGLAAPYGRLSEDLGGFRERFLPGAFTAALQRTEQARSDPSLRDARADVEHDGRVIARTSAGTLRFSEDSRGLWASLDVPDTTWGRDVLEDVRTKNLNGMSISFLRDGTEAQFHHEGGQVVREVSVAPLTAVTLCAYPAYTATVNTLTIRSLDQFRADQQASLKMRRRRLDLAAAECWR
jgi:HK97 family phage prohead protease